MCGIAGYFNTRSVPVKDSSRIIPMLKIQKHRGPDDSGIRAFSLNGQKSMEIDIHTPVQIEEDFDGLLGFNRLSILDLSKNGHQPMLSPDQKVLLAFNGEIYNAFDFKQELEEWGYQFKSTSDTEVILALYLKYGYEQMLCRLNGMFAIVVVDLNKQEILVARDRFGIKPMYFIANERLFAFSSELKSFTYLEGFHFQLNSKKLDEYVLFRNNLNDTLFEGVHSLKPGHYISFKKNGEYAIRSFFDVNHYSRNNRQDEDFNTVQKNLEGWLGQSVQRQLISDVKLGCQLSGGIDSTLVTWLANRNNQHKNFESVSIVFDDPRFSEEKYINHVRDTLSIPSHKFLLNSEYYLDHFEKATWHLESPLNHPNTIGIYMLSQRAKEHVTVLLSGEGADEVFGGYSWFYHVRYPYRLKKLMKEIRKSRMNPLLISRYLNPEYRAILATAYMDIHQAKSIRKDFHFDQAMADRLELYKRLDGSVFDKQVKYELQTYLPDLLIRQDKMSMAHSIENRVPFLDNEVVEKSFRIPEDYLLVKKINQGSNPEKYLLKRLCANTFGDEFAFRNKMGFGIPLREFFANKRFNEYLNDTILPGIRQRGLFNYPYVSDLMKNLNSLDRYELETIWNSVAFEAWAKVYGI